MGPYPPRATRGNTCVSMCIYIYIYMISRCRDRFKDLLFNLHAISSVKKRPLPWTWDHDDDHLSWRGNWLIESLGLWWPLFAVTAGVIIWFVISSVVSGISVSASLDADRILVTLLCVCVCVKICFACYVLHTFLSIGRGWISLSRWKGNVCYVA